jgi:hypothetical protein
VVQEKDVSNIIQGCKRTCVETVSINPDKDIIEPNTGSQLHEDINVNVKPEVKVEPKMSPMTPVTGQSAGQSGTCVAGQSSLTFTFNINFK